MTKRSIMLLTAMCFLLAALSIRAAAKGGEFSFPTPSDDRWHYPFNFTPGTRAIASCFGAAGIPTFNDRDGAIIIAWDTSEDICPGLGAEAYDIAAVVITLTNQANQFVNPSWPIDLSTDEWYTFDINTDGIINADGIPYDDPQDTDGESDDPDPGRPIELFGAGFGPVYTWDTWVQASFFEGSDGEADVPRDPFPFVYQDETLDLVHVEDSVKGLHNEGLAAPICGDVDGLCPFTPQSWAIGTPIGYTPGSQNVPFDIEFDVDLGLGGGAVRTYFQEGLGNGRVFAIVTSLREAALMGPQSGYPAFYMKEGLFDAGSKAPHLRVVLARPVLADFDGNCDVDLADHMEFYECLSGPDAGPVEPACGLFDFEPDADVDLADFSAMQRLIP